MLSLAVVTAHTILPAFLAFQCDAGGILCPALRWPRPTLSFQPLWHHSMMRAAFCAEPCVTLRRPVKSRPPLQPFWLSSVTQAARVAEPRGGLDPRPPLQPFWLPSVTQAARVAEPRGGETHALLSSLSWRDLDPAEGWSIGRCGGSRTTPAPLPSPSRSTLPSLRSSPSCFLHPRSLPFPPRSLPFPRTLPED